MYLALGIATIIYVAVSLGVFGTLTVDKVIASGGTALAVAAEPTLGGCRLLADDSDGAVLDRGRRRTPACTRPPACASRWRRGGQFPSFLGRHLGKRAPAGLVLSGRVRRLAAGFDLVPDRVDRQRRIGAPHLHARHRGSLPPSARDGRQPVHLGARRDQHLGRAHHVRVHHARRRTRDGRGPGRDHRALRADRLRLEAFPQYRDHGTAPAALTT